jgi:universal stress protein A
MRSRQILCPTDFSPASMHALSYAVEMANLYHVGFRLLHVISKPYGEDIVTHLLHEDNYGIVPVSAEELDKHMKAYATEKINKQLAMLHTELPIETIIRSGSAAAQILADADEANVGMIVLGTDKHSPLSHLFAPSVSEEVLRKARCPVLVVKGFD